MASSRDKREFDEQVALTGRAIVRAIADQQKEGGTAVDTEIVTSALMMVAAGLLSVAPNLTNRRAVRSSADAFGKMFREMAVANRAAADAGEATFLHILGVEVAPANSSKATH